jgi:acetyl-CoA carboxylase biotin carboxyl carrier protein
MELKEIQALIKFVANQGVDEVDIEKDDFKLSIKKHGDTSHVVTSAPQVVTSHIPVNTPPVSVPEPVAPASTEGGDAPSSSSNLIEIKSPMIGTFYRAANPESDSFANVGDEVSVGKVVCIIEAMKLFNEIESEVSGTIVKVLVDNASPVEYDQPLFLVEPH